MITRNAVYLIGLDLGQKNDYTALTVAKQYAVPTGSRATVRHRGGWVSVPDTEYHYDVIHAERWRDRPYHEVVGVVKGLFQPLRQLAFDAVKEEVMNDPEWGVGPIPTPRVITPLIVDATGVGAPVIDSLNQAGLGCIAITIHGGDAVSGSGSDLRVPKRDLVGTLQVLFQNKRLRVMDKLPLAPVLNSELQNFRAKIKLTGHDTYGAGADWRDGNHDDLVLSLAMAVWYGEVKDPAATAGWQDRLNEYIRSQF